VQLFLTETSLQPRSQIMITSPTTRIARLLPTALFALSLSACGAPPSEPPAPASAPAPISSEAQALRGEPIACGQSKPILCAITCDRTSCAKCCEVHDTCETNCSGAFGATCKCID
jgi:hypothetical protein